MEHVAEHIAVIIANGAAHIVDDVIERLERPQRGTNRGLRCIVLLKEHKVLAQEVNRAISARKFALPTPLVNAKELHTL